MKTPNIRPFKRSRHSIVLDVSVNDFDKGSVAFASILANVEDSKSSFLFYSGAQDVRWSRSSIGLAISRNAFEFQKVSDNPILEGTANSFCCFEAITPAATRISNRFYMVFSGRPALKSSRRIGIAFADDLRGPWHILGEILKPTHLWEGAHIDNGPTLVKLDETAFLVFYSSVTSPRKYDILASLRRYPIRRIGVAKIRIRGPSLSQIEAYKLATNPLKHLNGPKGSWNESVFCPGYFKLNDVHYLLPAASTYSLGFPYEQHIGIVSSNTPFFAKDHFNIENLIDGPSEKSQILPNIKSEIALDSPSPLLDREKGKLFLYYSVADRADYIWKIALTTFDLPHI